MEYLSYNALYDDNPNHFRQMCATSSSKDNALPLMNVSFCVEYQDYFTKTNSVAVTSSVQQEGKL
jgi:hypothetical protein